MCLVLLTVIFYLCIVDEGPYKHSNPSRPPDGALAIRRQSIPGICRNLLFHIDTQGQDERFFILGLNARDKSDHWMNGGGCQP